MEKKMRRRLCLSLSPLYHFKAERLLKPERRANQGFDPRVVPVDGGEPVRWSMQLCTTGKDDSTVP